MTPSRTPHLLAGRRQTRVDTPRMFRLIDRWLRLHPGDIWGHKLFYFWVHRGYIDLDSMAFSALEAAKEGDKLAALIFTLSTGLSPTQRSKVVRYFDHRGHALERQRREADLPPRHPICRVQPGAGVLLPLRTFPSYAPQFVVSVMFFPFDE